ncbi:MAG: carbohydrate kinase family protein [Nocardioides sp.]
MSPAVSARGGVLVIGEALVDIVDSGDSVEEHPGGSCANVAVALARLERPTTLVTQLGRDAYGDLVCRHLHDAGVELVVDEQPATSTARAVLDGDGAARYEFDLTWSLDPGVVHTRPAVVHVGSIGAVLEPGASAVRTLVEQYAADAYVFYDVNARPLLMPDLEQTRAAVEAIAAVADVVKASDEDIAFLFPGTPLEEVALRWLAGGCAAVAFTLGGDGAVCFSRGGRIEVPSVRVSVVDTIGAGDTFSAGLIDALWDVVSEPRERERLRALPAAAWAQVVGRGAAAAAVTVSRAGANPPWRHELS